MAEPLQTAGTAQIAILCHPLAGVGRSIGMAWQVRDLLASKAIGCQVFVADWPSDFQSFTDIWIIGGDGTLHYFINHYPENSLPLGVINGGTGNDFHWQLYGDLPLEALVSRILRSAPKRIDLGLCNGERFINGLGIGFEGAVAHDLSGRKKRSGKASYRAVVLCHIVGYSSKHYQMTADGELLSGYWLMVDVNNGGRSGGGFHVSPQAKPDDGWLDLMYIDAVHAIKRLRYLPVIERGQHLELPFVHGKRIRELQIKSNSPMCFHMDGDVHEAASLQISVLPGILRIRY
ncbi:MAG: hypothetical protein FJX89_06315 [Bacteroidetes bacterium]|nr:hypothetical protein [Bacteroidota bacterium]